MHINFARVDVNSNSENPVIGYLSAREHKELVAKAQSRLLHEGFRIMIHC